MKGVEVLKKAVNTTMEKKRLIKTQGREKTGGGYC